MPQISAAWDPADYVTGQASAAVVGGRFVRSSGGVTSSTGLRVPVGPPVAGGAVFGIATHDAANGDDVNVIHGNTILCRVETSATITAGSLLEVAANGTVLTRTTGIVVGKALEDCASGARVLVDRQQLA
jgi:hypothetical protein